MQVKLIDKMGSDLTVVNAARVSFAKESEWETIPEGCQDGNAPVRVVLMSRRGGERKPSVRRRERRRYRSIVGLRSVFQ